MPMRPIEIGDHVMAQALLTWKFSPLKVVDSNPEAIFITIDGNGSWRQRRGYVRGIDRGRGVVG